MEDAVLTEEAVYGAQMLKVSSFLSPKRLAVIDATSKASALRQTLDLFRECPYILEFPAFAEEILKREEVLSTGIGFGVGVPHVRSRQVRESVAALAVLRKPVEYGSMDNLPVNIILMIGMPDGEHDLYLKYLSKISLRFRDPVLREKIGACANAEALCRLISMV